MSMTTIIYHLICPTCIAISFGVLYNTPHKFYVSCSMVATLSWLVYVFTVNATSPAIASFLATLAAVLFSRVLTVKMKCPITIFLVPAIIPLVPGGGIYYTVYYIVMEQLSDALNKGIESVKIAFAIVIGIVCVVAIPREVFQKEYWKQRRIYKG